jgi:hypothetical protein
VVALQRSAGNQAVCGLLSAARPSVQRDQRTDTAIPTAAQQGLIQNELNPTTPTVGGAPAPAWDGAASQNGRLTPAAATARRELIREFADALRQHLTLGLGQRVRRGRALQLGSCRRALSL